MTRCSVAVMAHPSRAAAVDGLCARLDRDPTVVWDEVGIEWHTGRRAIAAVPDDATHHLVLQDDAVIPADLVAGVEAALDYVPPDAAMSLYLGRKGPDQARVNAIATAGQDRSWIVIPRMLHGVAVVLPAAWCEPIAAFAPRGIEMYDARISRWLVRHRCEVWYPNPSLVDHDESSPSLLGHDRHDGGRVAYRFIGQDRSALDFDPTRGVYLAPDPRGRIQYARRFADPTLSA